MTGVDVSRADAEIASDTAPPAPQQSLFASGASPFGLYERLLAGRYLRAKRAHGGVALIAIISFVGIMLAVFGLIATMSVMNGYRHVLISKIIGVEPHMYVYAPRGGTAEEIAAAAERFAAIPGVTNVAPAVNQFALGATEDSADAVQVRGLARADLERLDLITDSFIDGGLGRYGEGLNGGDEVIVGAGLARKLGLFAGDRISLIAPRGSATPFGMTPRRKVYSIAGVFDTGNTLVDDVYAFMPLAQARVFFGLGDRIDFLALRVEDAERVEEIEPLVRAEAPVFAFVQTWRQRSSSFDTALRVERTAMRIILAIVVAITALNIISGLVMLAKNKARDIAVLRTMGATRGGVLRVFLMIGATIGILGTMAGLILGILFVTNIGAIQGFVEFITGTRVFDPDVYLLSRIPARLQWGEVAFVTVWGFLMSCLASLPPAWNAARLDPVEALRNE